VHVYRLQGLVQQRTIAKLLPLRSGAADQDWPCADCSFIDRAGLSLGRSGVLMRPFAGGSSLPIVAGPSHIGHQAIRCRLPVISAVQGCSGAGRSWRALACGVGAGWNEPAGVGDAG